LTNQDVMHFPMTMNSFPLEHTPNYLQMHPLTDRKLETLMFTDYLSQLNEY
uniref:Hemocyanin_M domain-containing protein n=1 Tax=Brugia timori TaxID=42155 RepID=A0A0R3QDR4_9BILA